MVGPYALYAAIWRTGTYATWSDVHNAPAVDALFRLGCFATTD